MTLHVNVGMKICDVEVEYRGPIIDNCGTPKLTLLRSDVLSSILSNVT